RPKISEAIESAVFVNDAPLLCVQGPGGVGKTTVVADFGRRFANRFNQVLWLDVRAHAGATTGLLTELLEKIGAPAERAPSFAAALADLWAVLDQLASADKKTLVVFDNADYPDDHFYQLADTLAHSPTIVPIVTTRDRSMAERLDLQHIDV